MNKVKFTVLGEPKGKGRPRFTKIGKAFTPKQTVNYETLIRIEYGLQTKGFRFSNNAMLNMIILAYYPISKSGSKKLREKKRNNVIRPTIKPDMDNIVKIVADALNKIAYYDDTQIVDCQVSKFFSDNPRIEIEIKEVF
jgi:crossover junction endodeoxyribonuclease|nr:MAG TPA: Endodeoxyribonuclease RusA [Caudoviricetes sp.]